jgi:hypothetical protein
MHVCKTAVITVSSLVVSLGAHALQVQGANAPASATAKPLTPVPSIATERGGTITQLDMKKRQIVVDGVTYALQPTTKVGHVAGTRSRTSGELKVGHQIRFTTARSTSGSVDGVSQIWISGQDRRGFKP